MTDILLSTFLLSVVLLGIHSYFGIAIIRRGIIFTDLAIGQMAALGGAVSLTLGAGLSYPLSLLFSLAGGILIAYVSLGERASLASHGSHSHAEAFIGLLFAFGIAAVYILLSKSPLGIEEFQRIIAADILLTPFGDIAQVALLYAILGTLLVLLRNYKEGILKELIFFGIFSVTVTSSVRLVGVLVVFSLLVGPALISLRMQLKRPLIGAWVIGTTINVAGIALSYQLDLPTGYSFVLFHTLFAMGATLWTSFPSSRSPRDGS